MSSLDDFILTHAVLSGGAGGTCIYSNVQGTLGSSVVNIVGACLENGSSQRTITTFNIGDNLLGSENGLKVN